MTVRSEERPIVGRRTRGGRLHDSAAHGDFEGFGAFEGRHAEGFGAFEALGAEAAFDAACCSMWFVSRSAEHESACVARPTLSAA